MQEMQETWVPSLGLEDPLEKEMAAHSSILAWKIPWAEKPGGLQSKGLQKIRTWLSTHTGQEKQWGHVETVSKQKPEFWNLNHKWKI